MKKLFIILGLLLLAWNSCRHDKAPLTKEAYGYAQLDTLKQLLTVKDSADAVKTYVTTYANFGLDKEKIDLRQKVYVYATESTVELISHMDIDRLEGLVQTANKLALHNLLRSPGIYLMPCLVAFLLLAYYMGYRMALHMRVWGFILLRAVWNISFLIPILMFASMVFECPIFDRKTVPTMAALTDNAIPATVISEDILTGKPAVSLPEKTIYFWEGQYMYASGEISHDELVVLRDAYNGLTSVLHRLVWVIGCLFLFCGLRLFSVWARREIDKILVQNETEN